MAEGVEGFHSAFLLIFVAFGTIYLLADGQSFRMGCGKAGNCFHLGAGSHQGKESGNCQKQE
jgi:hypothetical protein